MTEKETAEILTLIQGEYPHSFAKLDERQFALKLELWIKEFAGDDYNLVYTAVRLLLETSIQFAPNIGQIREKMRMLTATEELSEADAWSMVSKACKNGLYGYEREYQKLPETVQKAIGAPEQLREWAMMDADTVQSVVASNFRRSYRAQQSREKELAMIPPGIRESLAAISERMRLTDGRAAS